MAKTKHHERCSGCEIAIINGVRCHEQGCPEAWRDKPRKCRECGFDFTPEERNQAVCSGCREEAY